MDDSDSDGKYKKPWNCNPVDEAIIRANERFRMALFVTDTALTVKTVATKAGISDRGVELSYDILQQMGKDIMLNGAEYSAKIDTLPGPVKAELEIRQIISEEFAEEQKAGGFQEPLYYTDEEAATGTPVQLDLEFSEDKDAEADDENGPAGKTPKRGYLN